MSVETAREMRTRIFVGETVRQAQVAADEPSRRFFTELHDAMHDDPDVREAIGDVVNLQPNRSMAYMAEFTIRACTAIELDLDPDFKPTTFIPTFQRLKEPFFYGELMTYTLFPISSNIASRGALLKFELAARGILDQVSVLELGCSGNQIGKKLRSGLPYDPVAVYDRTRVERQWQLLENPAYSRLMNRMIAQRIDIKRVDGVDFIDPDHPQARTFRRACSFYLSELFDERRQEEFEYLEEYHDPEIRWQNGFMEDFTVADYKAKIDDKRGPTAIYIPFSLYELINPADQRQTLHNAVDIVNNNGQDSGLVAILDDVRRIDNDYNVLLNKRRNRDLLHPTCSLWVYDSQQPELGFQEHMKLENGRGRRLTFEPALVRMLGERGIEAS